MLHVSLMPSWKGPEPLYLVRHGSFTNLKKDILFHFDCVILGRASFVDIVQLSLERKLQNQ